MSATAAQTRPAGMVSEPKKPYARQMTDKRREQNRRAQKVYRENLKKKLGELEDQVRKQQQPQRQTPMELNEPSVQETTGIQPPSPPAESKNQSTFINLNDAFAAAGDLALPTGKHLPTIELTMRSRHSSYTNSNTSPTSEQSIYPSKSSSNLPRYLAPEILAPPDSESPDMRSIWPLPSKVYWETYILPPKKRRTSGWGSSSNSNSSSRIPLGYTSTSSLSPFSDSSPSFGSSTGIPSPYLNHLRLLGESTFVATMSIAALLGISKSAFMNDHPSPFTLSANNSPTISPSVTSNAHIPKPLHPTPQQIILTHPVYLDCIIFPSFRSKAIILSSRGELDHCSLFLDLMHDGLICWGGEGANARNGRGMRDGVAWSVRSWEARPWFLRRWGWLIRLDLESLGRGEKVLSEAEDEDEDGILEGSRWWRSIHGEDDSDDGDDEDEHVEEEELGETFSKYASCNVGLREKDEYMEIGVDWPTEYKYPFERHEDGTKKLEPPPLGEKVTSRLVNASGVIEPRWLKTGLLL